jgi:hypothetical protein
MKVTRNIASSLYSSDPQAITDRLTKRYQGMNFEESDTVDESIIDLKNYMNHLVLPAFCKLLVMILTMCTLSFFV